MKIPVTMMLALSTALDLTFPAPCAMAGELKVLCTTFPIYQITRNVAEGRAGTTVDLLLPASLGCPHHYSLTPSDMRKLATADVLVVNGLGMEEFLGAPVKRANADVVVVDSAAGVEGLLAYGGRHHDAVSCDHAECARAYEWAGAFVLTAGMYSWTFSKRDGQYADPGMRMLMRSSAAVGKQAILQEHPSAEVFGADIPSANKGGDILGVEKPLFQLEFDPAAESTTYRVEIKTAGTYVFYTEHLPAEFEADAHYFKDAEGLDVEPVAEEPEGAHHHHHHGVNPHLFASPRQVARLALNIAEALGKADPEGAPVYERQARAYAVRMNELADTMAREVGKLKNNRIIQPHGVFDYLARDTGLEVVAVTQPHGQEPSAAKLLELVRVAREKKAGAVFTEPQYSPKVGLTLAREAGIPSAQLDPTASGPGDAPLDHFETVMRANLETLRATLGVHP